VDIGVTPWFFRIIETLELFKNTLSILINKSSKMKKQRIISDIGKGGINSTFPLEEKIKEYEKGLDYTVDETGNVYTILTERLKGVI